MLAGDGTISGANGRSRILEKVRLPSLDSVLRLIGWSACRKMNKAILVLLMRGSGINVLAFLDANGQRIRLPGSALTLSGFCTGGFCYMYGLFLYVDDGLVLLPQSGNPPASATTFMFLVVLGAPLSWQKVDLQAGLSWIGWGLALVFAVQLL